MSLAMASRSSGRPAGGPVVRRARRRARAWPPRGCAPGCRSPARRSRGGRSPCPGARGRLRPRQHLERRLGAQPGHAIREVHVHSPWGLSKALIILGTPWISRWWRSPRAGSGWAGTQGHPGERPRHRVWLDGFAIARGAGDQSRVRAAFSRTAGPPPPPWWQDPRFDDPDQPVVGVSWFEAARTASGCPARARLGCRPRRSGRRRRAAASRTRAFRGARTGRRRQPSTGRRVVTDTPANPLGMRRALGRLPRVVSRLGGRGLLRGDRPSRNPRGPETAPGASPGRRLAPSRSVEPRGPSLVPAPALRYSDYGFRVVSEAHAEAGLAGVPGTPPGRWRGSR